MHRKKRWLPLGAVTVRTRGYLPHWEMPGATYSVTFRLKDSLPKSVEERLREERRWLERTCPTQWAEAFERALDRELDLGHGRAFLEDERLAAIVARSLQHFDGVHYKLFAWCVMPTHVHVVFRPFADHQLGSIIGSWKSYTAGEINNVLGRSGSFWAREYYDRIVRDEQDLARTVRYVVENPRKARMGAWRWVFPT